MDAGHSDALTAYAAINTLRLDDLRPHIFRTHDGGKSWTEIVKGIPAGAPVNAVREDPKRKGLLFAGTEREVYVSFDDGDNWQSLRLNMAPSSVREWEAIRSTESPRFTPSWSGRRSRRISFSCFRNDSITRPMASRNGAGC